jgi:predicted TIM-barrel fold metal-dependent hydrolase
MTDHHDSSHGPTAREVRANAGHPIIDADGHVLEYPPAVEPFVREALGSVAYERYVARATPLANIMNADAARRGATRTPQSAWWGTPSANTHDLAAAAFPSLLVDRLDECGIDYSILFPTKGFGIAGIDDDELRNGVCRGFNDFYAATFAPYAARLTAAAVIPMHTPDEAVAEMRRARSLGFKVIGLPEGVWRRIPEPLPDNPSPFLMPGQTHWFDQFGIDSAYDYDPVWAAARELGFAVTFHGGLGHMPAGIYTSITNYSFNHIGAFAQRMHMLVKSLFLHGVTQRFPDINIAVLECGVAWGSSLLADVIGHWEKRGPGGLPLLDPSTIDWDALVADAQQHGADLLAFAGDHDVRAGLAQLPGTGVVPEVLDDFVALGARTKQDFVDRYVPRFWFGCEADDAGIPVAFGRTNPGGAKLQAIFSSDMGHWDAPDMTQIVPEAWEHVEHGLITAADFRAFVFDNPVALFAGPNPSFFAGTAVEGAVEGAADRAVGTPRAAAGAVASPTNG